MKVITSERNEAFRSLLRLKSRKGREEDGLFIIEGENLLSEAVKSGADVRLAILKAGGAREGAEEGLPDCKALMLTPPLFDRLADTVTPQPVMAVVARPKPDIGLLAAPGAGQGAGEGYIVMDRLQDPGNAGSVIRTADAAGFKAVIAVKGTVDVFSGKAVRAAAGAIFRMPVIDAGSGKEALSLLRENGIRAIACQMGGDTAYDSADLTGRVAFLLGNEGNGLSKELRSGADICAYIPMSPGADSLNAAMAAGIMMFEKRRQDAEKTRTIVGGSQGTA